MRIRVLLAVLFLSLNACTLAQQPTAAPTLTVTSAFTVAWIENGDLMSWQQSTGEVRRIASGGVVRPYIAPDGQHVAFTRGPQGVSESLWVVDTVGTAEQEIASRDTVRPVSGGRPLIGQVGWLDDDTLYFNTLAQTTNDLSARDDLYRAEIRTRELALILPPSEGGAFTFSPDRQHIVTVYAGTYNRRDAVIRVLDPLGQSQANLLFFDGVSTAASYKFYPEIFWTPDSSAVYVALPDPDLVYDESTAPATELWHLPIDVPSNRELIGSVEASFFGLPRWSFDNAALVFMRRAEGGADNTFELFIADSNGENPQLYVTGEAGSLEPPQWIDGTAHFLFQQDDALWLGSVNGAPQRLPNDTEPALSPVFAGEGVYVFAAFNSAGQVELRYASLDAIGEPSALIATIAGELPVLDAVVSEDG
jgi:hypothetical protein